MHQKGLHLQCLKHQLIYLRVLNAADQYQAIHIKNDQFLFFVSGGACSLRPDIAATEPNKSFPIFLLFPIFGKTKGLLVISKFCFGGTKGVLLNEIFVPPAGGGGGGPLSIKSLIVGREGGGLSSPYLFKKSIFVPPTGK